MTKPSTTGDPLIYTNTQQSTPLVNVTTLQNQTIILQSNESGVTFVFILDTIIFLFGILCLFCCLQNLSLWKVKKMKKMFTNVPFLDRVFIFLFSESEYLEFSKIYGQHVAIYLWFCKNLILFLAISTFLTLSILLPIHITGEVPSEFKNENFLIYTSVTMIKNSPEKYYAHVVVFFINILLIFYFLRRFINSKLVNNYNYGNIISNYSVTIKGLPKKIISNEELKTYLSEVFPNLEMIGVFLLYDVSGRIEMERELNFVNSRLKHYMFLNTQKKINLSLIEWKYGIFCKKVDALDYWNDQKENLENKLQLWKEQFTKFPKGTGYAHIIFKNKNDVKKCLEYSNYGHFKYSINNNLSFQIEKSHEPSDMNFVNYSVEWRFLRLIFIHLLLILFLIFFTTPLSIISAIQTILNKIPNSENILDQFKRASGYTGDILFHYLPTLSLFIITQCLPMIIPFLTKYEKYKSYSHESRVYQLRLFIYLFLSTLLLPLFLLSSLDGILNYLQFQNFTKALDKIYLPQSGVFFINYCIQYALLGNFVDIVRLKDLMNFVYNSFKVATKEEIIKNSKIGKFDLPLEYAYLISFFGIIFIFGIFSPIIMCIGFIYFISKYIIDRYNICRVCSKNQKQQRLIPDLISYQKRNQLNIQLMFTTILTTIIYTIIYFAKSGKETHIPLILISILGTLSFIYCVYWTISYRPDYNKDTLQQNTLQQEILFNEDDFNLEDYLAPFSLEIIKDQIEKGKF
ncbi:hypothetical protein ABK040_007350 [Willaertia magna]